MVAQNIFPSQGLRFNSGWRHLVDERPGSRHRHPTLELVYHLRGHGTTDLPGDRRIHFDEHSLEIYPPQTFHRQRMGSKGEDLCIFAEMSGATSSWPCAALFLPKVNRPDILEDLFWLASRPKDNDPLDQLARDHCLTSVMLRLIGIARSLNADLNGPPELFRAKAYIQSNFSSIRKMGEVARRVGISEDYLRHAFKKCFDISPNRFLMKVRIDHAKRTLVHTRLPQKIVAHTCGFQTERYFSTCFKRETGCTPGQYRKDNG